MTKKASRLIILAGFISAGVSQAQITGLVNTVVNAASFQRGLPSGGGVATAFCSGLANVKPGTYIAASSSPLPYELGGLRVIVSNGLAPLLAVVITSSGQSANAQINFQVPTERNASLVAFPQNPGALEVLNAATGNITAVVTPLPALPTWGGFFADASGYAVAQHASDYSTVTPQNPAHAGEAIIAYADDFFPVLPAPPIGFPTPQQPLFQVLPASLTSGIIVSWAVNSTYLYLQDYTQPICSAFPSMGCQSFTNTPALQVTFEGLAPGQVGVEQINFVVPSNQKPGDLALFFNYGSCPDGSGGRCSTSGAGLSSPYVKLPVR